MQIKKSTLKSCLLKVMTVTRDCQKQQNKKTNKYKFVSLLHTCQILKIFYNCFLNSPNLSGLTKIKQTKTFQII